MQVCLNPALFDLVKEDPVTHVQEPSRLLVVEVSHLQGFHDDPGLGPAGGVLVHLLQGRRVGWERKFPPQVRRNFLFLGCALEFGDNLFFVALKDGVKQRRGGRKE